jgi:preprotein translocase subunit SecY
MRLDMFKAVVPYLPVVKDAPHPPGLGEKFIWTAVVLLIFFTMYSVVPFGAELRQGQYIEFIQVVLASKMGTLLTVGIGPIILASIFLQLLAGAKVIDVDFQKPEDKANFSAAQKVLAIALSFIEAALFVLPGTYLSPSTTLGISPQILLALIVLQIALSSVMLLFLDEITSKYGIGSGISLFIAAGVSLAVVEGSFYLFFGGSGVPESITVMGRLAQGGATAIPSAIIALLPMVFTLLVIVVCLYAEGVRVEIPLAFDRVRGFGSRFPVKLLYVSVLPVILTSALLANVQLIGQVFLNNAHFSIAGVDVVPYIAYVDANGMRDGFLYLLTHFSSPLFSGGYEAYLALLAGSTPVFHIPEWIHVLVYSVAYVAMCVFFGKFWIEAAGMGPKDIANQITKTGLLVPGFRRDPRIIEGLLEKYISSITILGSIFVGLIAVAADLTGAIGSGTGILLTVGIMYKFYEDFKSQKLFDMYPGVAKFIEGG